jgi:hypothetical protein
MRVLGKLDDGGPRVESGPTFPENPQTGDIFEKTGDNHGPYYYSGTEWILLLTGSVVSELGYTPVNKAGDSMTGSLSMPKTSNEGIKVDNTFGWCDLIGNITPRVGDTDAPTLQNFIGNVREYAYSSMDSGDTRFHIPHDYVPSSNLFLHVHWGHNGTAISGDFVVTFYLTYAKGHNQTTFHAQKTATLTVSSLNLTSAPQYVHRVDEIQLSTSGGSSSMLDTDLLEVDGLILINYVVDTIPTITGSAHSDTPYVFTIDLHYQSTGLGTKNKSPNFYS